MTTHSCQSCSMKIESGTLCPYCADGDGNLRSFDEVFERFVQWTRRENPEQDRAAAEAATLAFMSSMPAWADHPRVAGAR